MGQAGIVDLRIMGQGDEGGPGVDVQARQRRIWPVRDQRNVGKALRRREGGSRIDDRHVEAERAGHRRHRLADVDGADHHEPDRRHMHRQEGPAALDLGHLAAALPDRAGDDLALLRAGERRFRQIRRADQFGLAALHVGEKRGGAAGGPLGVQRRKKRELHFRGST